MNASPGSWAASENELTEYMADSEELAWTALAKSSCFHIVFEQSQVLYFELGRG